jgi:hypothetical protein
VSVTSPAQPPAPDPQPSALPPCRCTRRSGNSGCHAVSRNFSAMAVVCTLQARPHVKRRMLGAPRDDATTQSTAARNATTPYTMSGTKFYMGRKPQKRLEGWSRARSNSPLNPRLHDVGKWRRCVYHTFQHHRLQIQNRYLNALTYTTRTCPIVN